MIFLVSLIALLTERFFHWGHLRDWRWFDLWLKRVTAGQYGHLSRFAGFFLLLPPVIVVALAQWILAGRYYQLLTLVLGTVVLLYTMGPDNFWQVFRAGQYNHLEAGKKSDSTDSSMTAVDAVLFSAVYDGVFAVLFWFWVLGPMGAVLYRVLAQASRLDPRPASLGGVITVRHWMDWIPVRFFGLLFALAGHFVTAFDVWKKHALAVPATSVQFLTDCGRAALSTAPGLPVSGEEALDLLDRVMIISLVILALVVLAL